VLVLRDKLDNDADVVQHAPSACVAHDTVEKVDLSELARVEEVWVNNGQGGEGGRSREKDCRKKRHGEKGTPARAGNVSHDHDPRYTLPSTLLLFLAPLSSSRPGSPMRKPTLSSSRQARQRKRRNRRQSDATPLTVLRSRRRVQIKIDTDSVLARGMAASPSASRQRGQRKGASPPGRPFEAEARAVHTAWPTATLRCERASLAEFIG
jgi:hypothetical protein